MIFTDEEQNKIDKLPIVLRQAVKYLSDALNNIINGNCNEEALTDTIATINNNSANRYNDNDLLTYDKACKELRISVTNRVKLKKLLDRNGIKQVIMHNQKVGFKRSEILALKSKMEKQRSEKRLNIIKKTSYNY